MREDQQDCQCCLRVRSRSAFHAWLRRGLVRTTSASILVRRAEEVYNAHTPHQVPAMLDLNPPWLMTVRAAGTRAEVLDRKGLP